MDNSSKRIDELPFAVKDNRVVHINEVKRGKKCGCICPDCRSPVLAAKGDIRQHHFKHIARGECHGGLESGIHKAAKQIITEKKQITLPEHVCTVSRKNWNGESLTKQQTIVKGGEPIYFSSVESEKQLHGIKPDLLAIKGNSHLIIEIFFRHKVDVEKLNKIKKANVSAIEINLSSLKATDMADWEAFWSSINDPQRIKWLHNAKALYVRENLIKELEAELQREKKQYEAKLLREQEVRKQNEIKAQKQATIEKDKLSRALNDLKILRSEEHIENLKEKAKVHPVWKKFKKEDELPEFADIPDGDWIFGCYRSVWQASCYSFIRDTSGGASLGMIAGWLEKSAGCKIPYCVKIVEIYGKRYPKMLPADILGQVPSPSKTLEAYLEYLRDLGKLDVSWD